MRGQPERLEPEDGGAAEARREVVVLAATKVGLYLFHGDERREVWRRSGPYLAPCDIAHATRDPRDGALWAAANGEQAWVYRSEDRGQAWRAMGGPLPVRQVWHVAPGRVDEPGTVYAGVMDAALYRSRDGGESWHLVSGLSAHPTREEWWPGGGGLCLHTILMPPRRPGRIYVAISVAGLFHSDDDGETWTPLNEGVADFREVYLAESGKEAAFPAVHRCVHKVVTHPADPDVLVQQNHLGVYRSDDGGERWRRIDAGLPSQFGFPIAIGAGPDAPIYVVPEEEPEIRTRERLAVWRSCDGGATWRELTAGLPTGRLNVLREGMAADSLAPTGVYLGTTSGALYASRDGGEHWSTLADDLPPVRSVKVGVVG